MKHSTTVRVLAVAAVLALVPAIAAAQAYTANLTGDTGTGFATIHISGEEINYNIVTSGLDSPTRAVITDGSTHHRSRRQLQRGLGVGDDLELRRSGQSPPTRAPSRSRSATAPAPSAAFSGSGGGGAPRCTSRWRRLCRDRPAPGSSPTRGSSTARRSGQRGNDYYPEGARQRSRSRPPVTVPANTQAVLDDFARDCSASTTARVGS